MFLAQMYCYGKDSEAAGITGIESCMGLILAHKRMIYAIHVPDNSQDVTDQGIDAFCKYVKTNDGSIPRSAQALLLVRVTAATRRDLRKACQALNLPLSYLIQLRTTPTAANHSTAVVCRWGNNDQPVFHCLAAGLIVNYLVLRPPRDGFYRNDTMARHLRTTSGALTDTRAPVVAGRYATLRAQDTA